MSFVNFGLCDITSLLTAFFLTLFLCRRMESVRDHVDRFGFTMCDAASDEIITDQKGVFRTNCLDWSV